MNYNANIGRISLGTAATTNLTPPAPGSAMERLHSVLQELQRAGVHLAQIGEKIYGHVPEQVQSADPYPSGINGLLELLHQRAVQLANAVEAVNSGL